MIFIRKAYYFVRSRMADTLLRYDDYFHCCDVSGQIIRRNVNHEALTLKVSCSSVQISTETTSILSSTRLCITSLNERNIEIFSPYIL